MLKSTSIQLLGRHPRRQSQADIRGQSSDGSVFRNLISISVIKCLILCLIGKKKKKSFFHFELQYKVLPKMLIDTC